MLASVDSGLTWTPRASGTQQHLLSIAFESTGQRGWVVGERGTLLTTQDSGTTWVPQKTGTERNLYSIAFDAKGERGWAVGERGTVLVSADGGTTWVQQDVGTQQNLFSIAFDRSGKLGWLAGSRGNLLVSIDSGASWRQVDTKTQQRLYAIAIQASGQLGWAAGWNGTILSTDDGGKTWTPRTTATQHDLTAVTFDVTGQRGWAAGEGGTLLASSDGGTTWSPAEQYRRYPAPWYWVAVVLCLGLGWQAWRRRPTGPTAVSVADMAASDTEVRSSDEDRLAFGGLARGISRFLRNTETRPPLTLAVTGDWGTGKSSLMRLVCADLKRFGHRPIWFNAWHHQKEDHLFAALLGAIRQQAVPGLGTPRGWLFRGHLLWRRSQRHAWLALALVFCLAVLMGIALRSDGLQWLSWLQELPWPTDLKTAQNDPGWWAPLVAKAPPWLIGLAALWVSLRTSKPFGVDPAVLLTGLGDGMSLKNAAAQNDFRSRFAQEFNDLVAALPTRLVIVVDDLDRCKPQSVLDVMEAVNFLTSAGECFVIFGMAPERVKAALGLAFKDIAAEMTQQDMQATNHTDLDATLARRRAYADEYLQKLVNIEIPVPKAETGDLHKLVVAPPSPARRHGSELLKATQRCAPMLGLMLALCSGAWVASDLKKAPQNPPTLSAPVPEASGTTVGQVGPIPEQLEIPNAPVSADLTPIKLGERHNLGDVLLWLLPALCSLGAMAAVIAWRLLSSTVQLTRDSDDFRTALGIWLPVVASHRHSPRAIKRFGNRMRYMAMLQQGQTKDDTWWDLIRKRWAAQGRSEKSQTTPVGRGVLAESQLLALGSLHACLGMRWRDAAVASGNDVLTFPTAVAKGLMIYRDRYEGAWPPSAEELTVFEQLLAGVRIEGDAEPLPPGGASAHVSKPDVDHQ